MRRPKQYRPQAYSAANRAAARIILEDAEQYGEESLMVRWAKLVMQDSTPASVPASFSSRFAQLPLFPPRLR